MAKDLLAATTLEVEVLDRQVASLEVVVYMAILDVGPSSTLHEWLC